MNREVINITKATAFYHYAVEYLLVSSNIKHDIDKLEDSLFNESFRDIIDSLIDTDKENGYIDSYMQSNMEILLDYLVQLNPILFTDISSKYHSYNKTVGGSFYENQLFIKYDKLDDYVNNKCIMWNAQAIRNSVTCDFAYIAALMSHNTSEFLTGQLSKFTLDQNFLYFIHKLINQYPCVIKDKDIKAKIKTILMCNELFSEPEVMKYKLNEFCIKNSIEDDELGYEKYQYFIEDNGKLLTKICMDKVYIDSCNISAYINAYNEVIVLNSLYKDGDLPQNPLMLDHVIKKIKDVHYNCFTLENKKAFIDVLSTLRPCIGKDQISLYNECIGYINSHSTVPTTAANARYFDVNRLSLPYRIIFKIYKKIYDEQDIGEKNIYEAIKDYFDHLNSNSPTDEYDPEELALTIKTLIRVYPKILTNQDICERIEQDMYLLPKSKFKKINKKIKKIKKEKKM